ncbi:hypothetical protein [Deinococcus enclensis]|uniref:Uncharacterized protein n=1 Tax=Deinococcus enclensis TaxID=1049582 RepID=A0ABT9MFJ9_9DEIO|nr:hypothetical protein [Deinococcus enclensis]MDP9765380.1 hypothetical protein [Deinococcus enclensis]
MKPARQGDRPVLRRADLTADQVRDLDAFRDALLAGGWASIGTYGGLFDAGWAVPYPLHLRQGVRGGSVTLMVACGPGGTPATLMVTVHQEGHSELLGVPSTGMDGELAFLAAVVHELDRGRLRAVLDLIAAQRTDVTINVQDEYLPLTSERVRSLFRHEGEPSRVVRLPE